MKFISGIVRLFRPEEYIVHDNVVDINRYRLKKVRLQAAKYGVRPENIRLHHTKGDLPPQIVAVLDGTIYNVTKRGLTR